MKTRKIPSQGFIIARYVELWEYLLMKLYPVKIKNESFWEEFIISEPPMGHWYRQWLKETGRCGKAWDEKS